MSSRSLILESDWLVFIDGVQVPHQGIRMQSSRNNLSSCTVTLEPDGLLTEYLRPQSVVSVWARERFPDKPGRNEKVLADAQSQYYLYWEGLLAGHTHAKSPTTRAMTIQCESIFMPWTRAKAFMFGVGAYPQSTVLSGSRKVRFGDGSVFSFAILGRRFANLEDTPFAKRIQDTVAFLSSANGVLRLQTDRYSLLDRINSMNDTVYEDLLAGKALNLIGDGMSDFPDDASVLAVINHLQQYGFYSHYEIFAPVKNEGQYPTQRESSFGVEDRHRFYQKYQLNQLLFLPELYFAPPPPCNFIFPDHIRSMSVGRNFYLEPTRALVPDPIQALSGFVYHLAPASILRGTDSSEITAREVFGMATSALQEVEEGGSASSPYEQDVEGGTVSLFQTILDSELEKGIVAKIDSYRFETLAAFANAQGAREGKNTDAENVDPNGYSQLISSVVNYRFRLDQYTREVTLDLMGHRDIVPGFSCAIFDEDVSYVGFVDSVDVSVDPLGTETTSVTLSKARQLSTPPLALLDRFAEAVERLDQIRREKIAETSKDAIQAAVTRNTLSGLLEDIGEALLGDEDPFINSLYLQAISTIQQEFDFEVDGLLDGLSEEMNVPLPPGFLNRDLLSPKKVDEAYERLLGCSRFYTSNYAYEVRTLPVSPEIIEEQVGSILDSDQIRNTQLEGMRMQAESMYALARVFRIDGKVVGGETQDTWQAVRDRSDSLGQTTFEWATRNFTKRKRYRLGDYCATNGLKLVVNTSDAPNPTPYLVMTPALLNSINFGVGTTTTWDNTLFSKLVNPVQTGATSRGRDVFDIVIAKRQSDAPGYLATRTRQAPIIQYSKRHFGARAFDGS